MLLLYHPNSTPQGNDAHGACNVCVQTLASAKAAYQLVPGRSLNIFLFVMNCHDNRRAIQRLRHLVSPHMQAEVLSGHGV